MSVLRKEVKRPASAPKEEQYGQRISQVKFFQFPLVENADQYIPFANVEGSLDDKEHNDEEDKEE